MTPAAPVFGDAQLSELAKKIGLSDTVTDIVDRAVASKIEDEPDGRDTVLARLRDAPGMESQWPKWSEEFDWWKQTPLPPSPGIEYLLRGYSPQHVEFKQQPFFFGLYGGTPSYDGHIIPKGMSFGIDDKIYTDIYMFQGSLDARDTLCGEMVSCILRRSADLKIVQMADEARARGNIMVYIRTTAITHTLVAPAIHSTRKSESPLVKKYVISSLIHLLRGLARVTYTTTLSLYRIPYQSSAFIFLGYARPTRHASNTHTDAKSPTSVRKRK